MSNIDCNACNELRETSPDFVQNGVTSRICTSLKNDTGFNPSLTTTHTDCEDLDTANDCLIGRMDQELEAFDSCDWKKFMHGFIPNLYELLKAMICAICGIWTNIHKLWDKVKDIDTDEIWCWLRHMTTPSNYTLHAYVDDDPSKAPMNHFRIAAGVSTRYSPSNPDAGVPMRIYVANNLMRISGSLKFDGNMPQSYTNGQTVKWLDFYDGGTEIETTSGGKSWKGNAPGEGLFVYEYQIDSCDFGFKSMWPAHLFAGYAGDFLFKAVMYSPGDKYPSDNGEADAKTYNPSNTDLRLLQVRLVNVRTWGTTRNNGSVTPNGITGVRACAEKWDC